MPLELGLWVPETAFASSLRSSSARSARRMPAMEWSAREPKATGLYMARALSFNRCEYDIPCAHELTPGANPSMTPMQTPWVIKSTATMTSRARSVTGGKVDDLDGPTLLTRSEGRQPAPVRILQAALFGQVAPVDEAAEIIACGSSSSCRGQVSGLQLVTTAESILNRGSANSQPRSAPSLISRCQTARNYCLDYLTPRFSDPA